MKIRRELDVTLCDGCGEQSYADPCLGGCGKEHCWRCRESLGIEYKHGVYVSGSGDGYYCLECDARLSLAGDVLLRAYQTIRSLKMELRGWSESFEIRKREAEERLLAVRAGKGKA